MTLAVSIRPVSHEDGPALIGAHRDSSDFHLPWATPFTTKAGFEIWFAATLTDRKVSFIVEAGGRLAGLINLNEIVRGSLLSAYLGYHVMAGQSGRGVMTEAVRQTIAHAFGPLGLHRVEANIQPGNARSRALVQRLGFQLEGFSPRYLRIAGAWRDHERWAKLADAPGE